MVVLHDDGSLAGGHFTSWWQGVYTARPVISNGVISTPPLTQGRAGGIKHLQELFNCDTHIVRDDWNSAANIHHEGYTAPMTIPWIMASFIHQVTSVDLTFLDCGKIWICAPVGWNTRNFYRVFSINTEFSACAHPTKAILNCSSPDRRTARRPVYTCCKKCGRYVGFGCDNGVVFQITFW